MFDRFCHRIPSATVVPRPARILVRHGDVGRRGPADRLALRRGRPRQRRRHPVLHERHAATHHQVRKEGTAIDSEFIGPFLEICWVGGVGKTRGREIKSLFKDVTA